MTVILGKDKLHKLQDNERLGQNRESEYLGAEDIDLSAEPILTIAATYNGLVTLQRGKENKDVLAFVEKSVPGLKNVRPLIVNATNRKTLRKLFKGVTAGILEGKKIQLYIDHNTKDPQDGGVTDGIKIRPYLPRETGTAKCSECGEEVTAAGQMTAIQTVAFAKAKFGRVLCAGCMKRLTEKPATPEQPAPTEPEAQEENHAE